MRRADALERWQLIAEGALRDEEGHPIDLVSWIEEVARKVVKANQSSQVSPNDLARAIGLTGKRGTPPETVQKIKLWNSFEPPEYWKYFEGRKDARDHAAVVHSYKREMPDRDWAGLTDEAIYEKARQWTRRIATIAYARSVAPKDWENCSDEEVIKRVKRMFDED
jgi:hypothetical protein